MTPEDMRGKSPDELKDALRDRRKEAFNLRFQRAGGQLENTAQVRTVRRDIARIKTVLAERASSDANPAAKRKKG